MIKRATLILTILLVAGLMFSCPCYDDAVQYTFSHRDVVVQNLDNSGEFIKVAETERVLKTAYGIRIYLQKEEYELCSECPSRANFGLIETAYAYVCEVPDYYYPIETIEAIRIITLNDFDDTHSAGSDVAEYFKVADSFETIEEYLRRYNVGGERYSHYQFNTEGIDMLLMTPPNKSIAYKFRVEIPLSDGRILVNETDEIDLIL